jgi:hypothetical protein
MSFKNYLTSTKVEDKVNTFKENVLYDKDFSNAFLELTSVMDEETQSELFEEVIGTTINTLVERLKKYNGDY